jgi:hypothetical protein
MRAQEFITEDKNKYAGTTVYHGTAMKYAQQIVKTGGLKPRPNKYEEVVGRNYGQEWTDEHSKKQTIALFVATDLKTAADFGSYGASFSSGTYFREVVVFAFEILPTDIVKGPEEGFVATEKTELLIQNTITPDRLRIVYPKDMTMDDLLGKVAATKSKADMVRAINKIIKNPDWKIASAGNKDNRIHLIHTGKDNKGKPYPSKMTSGKPFAITDLAKVLASKPTFEVGVWNPESGPHGDYVKEPLQVKVTPDQLKQIEKIIGGEE